MNADAPSTWQARIARAQALASSHPATAEVLQFYAQVVRYQDRLINGHAARARLPGLTLPPGSTPQEFVARLHRPRLRAMVPGLLKFLVDVAPRPLKEAATTMLGEGPDERQRMFEAYWTWASDEGASIDETRAFIVEAALQPFAESLASTWTTRADEAASHLSETAGAPGAEAVRDAEAQSGAAQARTDGSADSTGAAPDDSAAPGTLARDDGRRRCPVCGGRPVVGLLREAGQGARRSLVCGLCSHEWRMPRALCPACGEDQADALAVLRTEDFPAVQIDACGSCRTYLKTIDLTVDNTAVPAADDLASLPLDLWVREQRYWRIRPHLLRL